MSMLFALAAAVTLGPVQACEAPVASDGDTIRCADGTRIRMSGIDAPEMPGHCRRGRVCAPGDPVRSRDSLRAAIATGPITYRAISVRDPYGRTIALVYNGSVNLSCHQIASQNAIYVQRWDNGGFVRQECSL